MKHRTRAEEQESLEARVVEGVIEAGHEPHRRKGRQPVALEHEPGADAEEDDPDVLDRVIGQESLEIVFHERVQHAQQRGDGSRGQDDGAPPGRAAAEQVQRDPQQPVDAKLDHRAGHQRRHVARRGRMCERQPDVERHQPRLRAEPDESENEHRIARRGWQRCGRGAQVGEPGRGRAG